jgi:membrane protease YdiL (CAAX protease family)
MSQEPPPPPESEEGAGGSPRETVVLLAILVEGGLLVLASILGWAFDQPPLQGVTWDVRGVLLGVAAALPLFAAFLLAQWVPLGPLRRLRRFGEEVVRPLLAPCSVIDLLGISGLAGLGEEVLFRGVLQGALARWLGFGWALAIASVLFGLVHFVTLSYAVLATLAGLYLGAVWLYADNLLAAVVAHALYDFLALLWLLYGPGKTSSPPAGEPDQSGQKEGEP